MVAKKDLKTIPWERVGVNLNTPARTIKMVRPVCPMTVDVDQDDSASPGCETTEYGAWWVACEEKGHNPYFQLGTKPTKIPVVVEKDDGRKIVTGYEEIELIESVRTAQVPLGPRFNSGALVEEKRFFHGYKYPHELGFHDMCEFRNCFAPDPQVKTRYGVFCSEAQAKMITADARHMVLEVFNQDKRREQIEDINVK